MLSDLWTRAWAWYTKRDRGERFEIRLIFDEEEAKTGKVGPNNKIYSWETPATVKEAAEKAAMIPGVKKVEIVDRHMFWVQLQLKVHTLDALDHPKIVEGKPISIIPETANVSIRQLLQETAPGLVQELAKVATDASILLAEEARVMTYASSYGEDIIIHQFRRVESDHNHFIVRRGNFILNSNGTWVDRESAFVGVTPFDSMLDACRAILGNEFKELEDATNLWFGGDETRQPAAPQP
jgi:hypothetical protein